MPPVAYDRLQPRLVGCVMLEVHATHAASYAVHAHHDAAKVYFVRSVMLMQR